MSTPNGPSQPRRSSSSASSSSVAGGLIPSSPSPSSPSTPAMSSPNPSLSRSTGKRTMRQASSDVLSAHPLLASDQTTPPVEILSSSGPYAVYSPKSITSTMSSRTNTPNMNTTNKEIHQDEPSKGTSSTLSSSTPISSTIAPPLISRTSNSTLPYRKPSTTSNPHFPTSIMSSTRSNSRPHSRSISEAQELLQSTRLKSELKTLGLTNDALGSAMIQRLVTAFINGENADWKDVLNCFNSRDQTKIIMLLPEEKWPPNINLNPSLFLDHLAIVDEVSPLKRKAFVTLSGFRGFIDQNELVLASYIKPNLNLDLLDPDVHGPILNNIYRKATSATYPSIALSVSGITKLAIPRPSSSRSASPLPSSSRAGTSTSSRLAALFVKPSSTTTTITDDLPPVVAAPPGLLSGSTTPIQTTSMNSESNSSRHAQDISILVIQKILRPNEMIKTLYESITNELKSSLKSIEGCSDLGIVDKVLNFVNQIIPSVWGPNGIAAGFSIDFERVSDLYQDSSDGIRIDLARSIKTLMLESSQSGDEFKFESKDYIDLENRVDASLEKIELLVMSLLYDRLFSPLNSNDAQEDENLSSRIKALNLLELSLDHLGVDLEASERDPDWSKQSKTMRECLEDVIVVVGKGMEQLSDPTIRSPKAKLDVFVDLHKLIVDQLSELPSIPLKNEVNTFKSFDTEVEMDDTRSRTSGTDSRSLSPTREMDEESALKTPRPSSASSTSNVPDLNLPESELTSSVHEATSSSLFDPTPNSNSMNDPISEKKVVDKAVSKKTSSSSADLILPLLIYATVQHNPSLPSNLRYVQRFRAESLLRGEASYCSTNIQAVIEFLNHVDLSSLGLNTQKLFDSTPISSSSSSLTTSSILNTLTSSRTSSTTTTNPTHPIKSSVPSTTKELDQFVDQANRSLVNVVGMLFGPNGFAPKTLEDVKNVLDGAGNAVARKATSGIRRNQFGNTTNTAASNTDSDVVEASTKEKMGRKGKEREMVDFVPGSVDESIDSLETNEYVQPEPFVEPIDLNTDTRSIRSISSLLRRDSNAGGGGSQIEVGQRPSLGERIASIPGLSRFAAPNENKFSNGMNSNGTIVNNGGGGGGKTASFFAAINPASPNRSRRGTVSSLNESISNVPIVASSSSSFTNGNARPVQKFLEMDANELKLGDVAELLREYKKLSSAFVVLQEKETGSLIGLVGAKD